MSKTAKNRKIVISVICGAVLLVLAVLLILYNTVGYQFTKSKNPPIDYAGFNMDAVLSAEQVSQDKAELIANLENFHPYFVLNEIDGYDKAKQQFSDALISTPEDFYFAASEFLAVFNDLHTRTQPISPVLGFISDIPYFADNGMMMMRVRGMDEPALELYAVNGVLYEDIIHEVLRYFPQENNNSYAIWLERVFSEGLLRKAGVEYSDALTLTFKEIDGSLFDADYQLSGNTADASESPSPNFETVVKGVVLHIISRSFYDDGSYKPCIDEIKQAVKNGAKKVVIDVRGNRGGNDGYASGILNALGFKYSEMGFTVRYSEATAAYRGTWHKNGSKNLQSFVYNSGNPNDIDLKVLCDEISGSAAMTIVSQCVYSDLGELIGRTPGQNASYCGNPVQFQLTNSKVVYLIPLSYSYFERDGQKVVGGVQVDIEVPPSSDYMDFIVWK